MNVTNEFLEGAVAAVSGSLEVDAAASGNMESIGYYWYRIYDSRTGECAVVLMDEGDGHHQVIAFKESCEADDKASFTNALLKTISFGASGTLFCVLDDGWVNAKYIDADVLRAALEKDAAEINCDFDFAAWAKGHGLASKSRAKRKQ